MGTRSLVRVSSAPKPVTMMRWSALSAVCSMKGMVRYSPGPAMRLNLPKRKMTTFSHCMAMCAHIVAAQATASAPKSHQTLNSPVSANPPPSTQANTTTATKAEKTSGPFWEVRRSTLELYFSIPVARRARPSRSVFAVRFSMELSPSSRIRTSRPSNGGSRPSCAG